MPALGAAFGVLIGLTLAGEAGYLKSAQDIVANEAAAASRLAWAATSPGVRSQPIHDALGDYLQATRAREWRGTGAEEGDPGVAATIATLEQVVRAEAARAGARHAGQHRTARLVGCRDRRAPRARRRRIT